ncbi:MAG: M10 family metallopeptidase C-terminal domain-containing protein, partial [Magnetococcales bacterium]|nr:M10 family metallopeptidase C-terminal domain-containing protein [Magnetococcales bacterium]
MNFTQTSGSDTMTGSAGNDTLEGGFGADYLDGGLGNDILVGGNDGEWDSLYGNEGDDTLTGHGYLYGGNGVDTLSGTGYLYGEAGNDTIAGSGYLFGGQGDDLLTGSTGDDQLRGDAGADTLTGGAGADTFYYDYSALTYNYTLGRYAMVGSDVIADFSAEDRLDLTNLLSNFGYYGANPFGDGWLQAEQVGTDLVIRLDYNGHGDGFTDTVVTLNHATLDLLVGTLLPGGIQMNFTQTSAIDTFAGNALDTKYIWDQNTTFSGHDIIQDVGGQDMLLFENLHGVAIRVNETVGSAATDPLHVDIDTGVVASTGGTASLTFAAPESQIDLSRGVEEIHVEELATNANHWSAQTSGIGSGSSAYIVAGDAGNDVLDLSGLTDAGHTLVLGGAGNDTLKGTTGQDVIKGGVGDDLLQGGAGRDVLTGGYGADVFKYASVSEGSSSFAAADRITDFTPGQDKIQVVDSGFGGVQSHSGGTFAPGVNYVEIAWSARDTATLDTDMQNGVLDGLATAAGVAGGKPYLAFLSFTDNDGGSDSNQYLVYDADAATPGGMTVVSELPYVTATQFSHTDVTFG